MGYQALLFCPDEKIARTVTQVLSELEFAVEPCIEPFAAVKKLMAEHFDAVVVDCDNDQNASLLFKSARNSSINQAALAVAVVEGQAGVAKAFRIGANLVLTKPINVEQAKGTLRVARGLLRKGEGAKPAAPAGTAPAPSATIPSIPPPSGAKPPVAVPAPPARPATLSAATARPRPIVAPAAKSAAANPAAVAAHASSASSAPINAMGTGAAELSAKTDAASLPSTVSATANNAVSPATSSGAASAPAPAREAAAPVVEAAPIQNPVAPPEKISDASPAEAHVPESKSSESATTIAPPAFTFGGANLPEKSESGGNKKIFLIIAAAALLVCALYFGWTQLHENPSGSSTPASPSSTRIPTASQPPGRSPGASSPSSATAQPQPPVGDITLSTSDVATDESARDKDEVSAPVAGSKRSAASPATKSTPDSKSDPKPEVSPIVVKSGATKSSAKPAAADTSAPSMVGLAAGGSDGSLSNLTTGDNAPKPVLQTLTVSQGVSQGLLLKKVQPAYPPTALRMRTEGAVKLLATVGKTGNVNDVKVVSGDPLLSKSAVDAVKQWKYKPYLLNGDPVEIQTEVTINFKLPN